MNQSQEQLQTLLSDYVDGNLTGEELATVEAYLEANPGVRDAVNRLMIDSEALQSLPRVTAPFDFSEDVRGQLERDLLLDSGRMAHPRRRRISSVVASVAALLVIFIGLGGGAYWMLANRPAPLIDLAIHAPVHHAAEDEAREDKVVVGEEKELAEPSGQKGEAAQRDLEFALRPTPLGQAADLGKRPEAATPPAEALPHRVAAGKGAEPHMAAAAPVLGRGAISAPPAEVAQLVNEAPRYNRRAVAVVIDSKDAEPANQSIAHFLASNAVRTQALSYDATLGRATISPHFADRLANASGGQLGQQSQVSGVVSNSEVGPITQAMQSSFSPSLPEPQVLMAIGLTDAQVEELSASLQKDLGQDRAATYDLGEHRSANPEEAGEFAAVHDEARRAADLSPGVSATTQALPSKVEASPSTRPAILATGDRLSITLIDPDAGGARHRRETVVHADGTVDVPEIGSVRAQGMTIQALRQSIVERYVTQWKMRDPQLEIELFPHPPTTQPHPPAAANTASDAALLETSVAVPVKASEAGDLVDVFLVVRPESPTTAPAERLPSLETTPPPP